MPAIHHARRPCASPLWQIGHHAWDDFIACYEKHHRRAMGPLRPDAVATVRALLRCGDLAAGFTRFHCPECGRRHRHPATTGTPWQAIREWIPDDDAEPGGDLFDQRSDSGKPVEIRREDGSILVLDSIGSSDWCCLHYRCDFIEGAVESSGDAGQGAQASNWGAQCDSCAHGAVPCEHGVRFGDTERAGEEGPAKWRGSHTGAIPVLHFVLHRPQCWQTLTDTVIWP